jgi:CheY-like chemotaxis protein
MSDIAAKPTIVLAEDDDGHAILIERNLGRAGLDSRLVRVRNGLELLDLFQRDEEITKKQLLVLLDLRMPYLDGVEALRWLKANELTAKIPVWVLTTSDDRREIERCFRLGCNVYITKPVGYEALSDAVARLGSFLQITNLPGGAREERP